jgi:hypothetical protein
VCWFQYRPLRQLSQRSVPVLFFYRVVQQGLFEKPGELSGLLAEGGDAGVAGEVEAFARRVGQDQVEFAGGIALEVVKDKAQKQQAAHRGYKDKNLKELPGKHYADPSCSSIRYIVNLLKLTVRAIQAIFSPRRFISTMARTCSSVTLIRRPFGSRPISSLLPWRLVDRPGHARRVVRFQTLRQTLTYWP